MSRRSPWEWASLLLFPPRCAVCKEPVPAGPALCEGCFSRLASHPGEERPGGRSFSLCLSAFPYGEAVRPLFDRLKSGDEGAADQLAALMIARWEARGLAAPDIAAFVPAKPGRYGQAEALARRIGPALGAKVLDRFLTRHQNSRVQHTLPMEERLKNAAASYARAEERFVSGRVLLVDDIVTTGATLSACAQLLLTAGAREVLCLTAAATPRLYL